MDYPAVMILSEAIHHHFCCLVILNSLYSSTTVPWLALAVCFWQRESAVALLKDTGLQYDYLSARSRLICQTASVCVFMLFMGH